MAQEKTVKSGDRVLVVQRKTTTKPLLTQNPDTVIEVKGTQVTVEREGKKSRKRNLAKVKILKEGPDRLKTKCKVIEEEEEEEWWESPQCQRSSS